MVEVQEEPAGQVVHSALPEVKENEVGAEQVDAATLGLGQLVPAAHVEQTVLVVSGTVP